MKLRNYTHKDFEELDSWWRTYREPGPTKDMLPLDSTYLVEDENGEKLCSVSLILTNIKEYCYIENLISNPEAPRHLVREGISMMNGHISKVAKNLEYKRLLCLTYKSKLVPVYEELGYNKTCDGLTSFMRVL